MEINGDKILGEILDRPNRFVLKVKVGNSVELAHLRDPGRLGELIERGRKVLLRKREKVIKTKYEVLAIKNNGFWVFTNSGYHSKIVEDAIKKGNIKELADCEIIKKEAKIGRSRIDFMLKCNSSKTLLEVKGCTLVVDGYALFPDAPTERGEKHLRELIHARKKGYESVVLFIIMRPDASVFTPNGHTDPKFAKTLMEASENNVKILAYKFSYDGDKIEILGKVPICLDCYKNVDKTKLPKRKR